VGSKLRIHYFHRADLDPDPHDHPFGFWTFPLKSYWEEVWYPNYTTPDIRRVPAFKWSYRPARHRHRILSRTLTIVWRDLSKPEREWFFYRDGITPVPWRFYIELPPAQTEPTSGHDTG
jgi:hypothetical protein